MILYVENPEKSTKQLSELVKDIQESWEIHEQYRKIKCTYLCLMNYSERKLRT